MFDTYEEIFAERAGSYQHAMEALPHARDREFMAMVDPLGCIDAKTLCDMPAGGGYLHRYLPEGICYIAVEPSSTFIANCPTHTRCRVVQAPIEQVPLETGSVDFVLSLAGLHHCPDVGAVFHEMRRLARDQGMAVIADVQHGTRPASFLNGYVDANNPLGHRGTFLDEATAPLLRQAGFELIEDRLIEIPWSFDNPHEAGAYCSALFGIEDVPAKDVANAMAAELGICPGPGAYNVRWELRRIVCTVV